MELIRVYNIVLNRDERVTHNMTA